jgi:hypothetical protein
LLPWLLVSLSFNLLLLFLEAFWLYQQSNCLWKLCKSVMFSRIASGGKFAV